MYTKYNILFHISVTKNARLLLPKMPFQKQSH